MDKKYVKGFVINIGGIILYIVIMVRSINIFGVVGIESVLENVNNDDLIVLNGFSGVVIINLSEVELSEY